MTQEKIQELQEFYTNLGKMANKELVPTGAVIINEDLRDEVLDTIDKFEIKKIETTDKHPDEIVKAVYEALARNEGVLLLVNSPLDPKLLNHLKSLSENYLNIVFPGDSQPTNVREISDGGFITFILTSELYNDSHLEGLINNFCNITE